MTSLFFARFLLFLLLAPMVLLALTVCAVMAWLCGAGIDTVREQAQANFLRFVERWWE